MIFLSLIDLLVILIPIRVIMIPINHTSFRLNDTFKRGKQEIIELYSSN